MTVPEIRRLTDQIRRADPRSIQDQREVHAWLLQIRLLLERGGAVDLLDTLDALGMLVRCSIDRAQVTPEEVHGCVRKVVERIDYTFNGAALATPGRSYLDDAPMAAAEPGPSPRITRTTRTRLTVAPTPLAEAATPGPPATLPKPPSPEGGMVLGEILVQFGIVTQAQVDQVLAIQATSGRQLGQVLVEQGFATAEDVGNALRFQASLQGAKAAEAAPDRRAAVGQVDQSLLGEVLVGLHSVSREELVQGLAHQRVHGGRIGDALVAIGATSRFQVEEAVRLQERLKSIPGA